jgi:hypothetical protein
MKTLIAIAIALFAVSPGLADEAPAALLAGFEQSPHFSEQTRTFTYSTDVRIHINAPAPAAFRYGRPVRLLIYALPNGNTTAQTIGKKLAEGVDWHFNIQHIGAQVRRLRETVTDYTLIVAYLEVDSRSWPKWCREHADSGPKAIEIIEAVRAAVPVKDVPVDLASHSGGGALLFALINQSGEIPNWIGRLVLLDSNYNYDDASPQADKLLAWLNADAAHHLGVIAYDDRNITVDGKPVIGPNGGTYRRTSEMLAHFGKSVEFADTQDGPIGRHRALHGQLEITLLENPDNKILHTVLVEKNGLIHGQTFGTPWEGKAGVFWQDRAYSDWIQPE